MPSYSPGSSIAGFRLVNVFTGALLFGIGVFLLYLGLVQFTRTPPTYDLFGVDAFVFAGLIQVIAALVVLSVDFSERS